MVSRNDSKSSLKYYFFSTKKIGLIFWSNPMSQLKLRCKMDITWFPYDEQICTAIFGSWSYTSNCLNYSKLNEVPSLKNYTENSEWILTDILSSRFEIRYDHWFDNNSFSEIKYEIHLKRKSLFIIQNYVISSIFLCILSLTSFFIPFAQGIKIFNFNI
jgi:nicotinic acetylcholine receptor, invertebrate